VPIYEYQTSDSRNSCPNCLNSFEVFQDIDENPISTCPSCGNKVKKIISWCWSATAEIPKDGVRIRKKIKEYENKSMWSHAAELADKYSEKTKDNNLKLRALDNYKKAGYDTNTLANYAKSNNE
jgi:putative FmdB family regulatory protein